MTRRVQTAFISLSCVLSMASGCAAGSDGIEPVPGTGGQQTGDARGSSGGAMGRGGTSASGGAPGSGGDGDSGNSGSGGRSGSGGMLGTGGLVGSGGRPSGGSGGAATGGSSGTGGRSSGNGGGNGTGGRLGTGGSGSGSGGSASSCTAPAPSGGTQYCSSNKSGDAGGGYSYTIWSSGSGGCITPHGVGAAFKATWNSSGDFLARVGLALGSNKTYDQFGTFSADFAETKTGSGGGYSYIGIYGWSVNPLHEFYIVDDWFGSRPNPGKKVGTITIDGGTYDILTQTQTNQPSITGTATFVQFWSVRQSARACGHISISEHFKAWAGAGMTLGSMEEAKVLIEVGGGNGSIDFSSASLTAK
jgi:endo-1,4-beta-xylanase